MNQYLKTAKQNIRAFIRQHWSDAKLYEVYAFNSDNRMCYMDSCGCLLGVTLAAQLHNCFQQQLGHDNHYIAAKGLAGARPAEQAYGTLGYVYTRRGMSPVQPEYPYAQLLRGRRLSAILRAEMRRRASLSRPAERTQEHKTDLVTA